MESDERADEIAVTEREFRVCKRCGETRVVSENTEVRAFGEEKEEIETSTFAPSEEFETEETEDAAIIEGTLDTSSTGTSEEEEDKTDTEVIKEEGENEGDEEDVKERVREATGTEVTHDEKSEETDADYVCPDCGFTATGGSFRAGDICPDCGGYIEEV